MSLVPQLGLPELLVIAVLVLLVVGPKDLPKFLYSAGQMFGKARRLADEFRAGLSQMAREAEMDEMRREIEELKKASPAEEIKAAMRDLEADVRSATPPPVRETTEDEDDLGSEDHHLNEAFEDEDHDGPDFDDALTTTTGKKAASDG
jgi:sec-independent protein translocase protein TatB